MVESSESADQIPDDCHVNGSQDIVIESDSGAGVTVISNHSETQSKRQSAHALLHLSKSQSDGSDLQVSDILAAHRHSENVMSEEEQVWKLYLLVVSCSCCCCSLARKRQA